VTAPLRVVCALDSFKGSLTSREACEAVRAGVLLAVPSASVTVAPIADGGEGTVEALAASGGLVEVPGVDLLGVPMPAPIAVLGDTAVIESASVAGIGRLASISPDVARRVSTAGLGLLARDALDLPGVTRVLVGLGGTGSTDGGIGFLLGLGARAWDAQGEPISADGSRGNPLLLRPARVEVPHLGASIVGLADVTSPLLGPAGAARMFGPQKGADAPLVEALESAMQVWAAALADAGADVAGRAGAGAAGGLGAAVLALGGTLEPGLARIAAEVGLAQILADADLVFTGEGRIDAQTAMGKAPAEVARMAVASARGARPVVIALAGAVDAQPGGDIDAALPIHSVPRTLAEAMDPAVAASELAATAERAVRLVLASRR